jgi:tRNA(adenine34) deaminase
VTSRAPEGAAPVVDRHWMLEALAEARAAGARGEVPIGEVVVDATGLVGRGGNTTIAACDPSGHAEIVALRDAARRRGNHRLPDAVLYVTVEPCAMCVGAMLQARVARLVFGCADPKAGAAGSLFDLVADSRLNHRIAVTDGVEADAARTLLQDFFRARRRT